MKDINRIDITLLFLNTVYRAFVGTLVRMEKLINEKQMLFIC